MWDESRCPGQRGRAALRHWLGEGAGPRAGFRLRGTGRLELCSGSRWGGAWGVGTAFRTLKAPPTHPPLSWDSGVELLQSWWSQAQVAARMVWAAGGARAQRPGLPSAWPQPLRLPGGPPHRRR